MSFFKKPYELIDNAPKALDWDVYESVVIEEYKELLKQKGHEESVFQEFFERNPAFLPGAFGIYGESGHPPYNNALITQPLLHGLTSKIPDFLWIASDSGTIYPIFIEIETPNKRWFRNNGVPTAEFTQAQNQLSDWKIWLSNPIHQNLFYQYYDIEREIASGKFVRPQFILIFGSRSEFEGKPEINQKRAQLVRDNEIYMTFDRLLPNIKARNSITCKVRNRKYTAKFVSPTFRLGPVYAEELSKVDNKVEAINNSRIDDMRKDFILSRLTYWEEFGRKQRNGLRNTGDWE
ncbi:hypothetical protein COE95_13145 [Bacillus toyonensis]|uniref:Shedu immune nuclease family protein n=1 Tax=Bacillus toyonensis TaxID=155322 RepID=UPI000BF387CE|nr:Shedu immune nuclease family protein [Bacillus toyonensis]PEP90534.1 hypothetical protein CN583_17470 [Bacillus toyonensis]PHC31193.1 hypothetical protein COE95_13145 [Bacillus toyonensis]